MDTWKLDWFGSDVVCGFVLAAVVCWLVYRWAGWVTKDIKW